MALRRSAATWLRESQAKRASWRSPWTYSCGVIIGEGTLRNKGKATASRSQRQWALHPSHGRSGLAAARLVRSGSGWESRFRFSSRGEHAMRDGVPSFSAFLSGDAAIVPCVRAHTHWQQNQSYGLITERRQSPGKTVSVERVERRLAAVVAGDPPRDPPLVG